MVVNGGLFCMDTIEKEPLLVSDLFIKEVNKYKRSLPWIKYDRIEEDIVNHFCDLGYSVPYVKEALRLLNSNNKRRVRCYDKIIWLFDNYDVVFFGTLTFKDQVLNNTTSETRRRYVSRYLKSISDCYVANIDFGDKEKNPESNEREHYHCLLAIDKEPSSWPYGFSKFKKVILKDDSATCLSKYIVKLSRHALKQTSNGKAPRLIYSKSVAPSWLLE